MKRLFVVVLLVLFLFGCGGGSVGTKPPTSQEPLDPQGNWIFTFTASGNAGTWLAAGQLFELNPPVVTSNTFIFGPDPYNGQACSGSLKFAGQASGTDTIDLNADQVESTNTIPAHYALTGTIAPDQQHMSGSYTSSAGCKEGFAATNATSGTWSAQLLPPVTGTWNGTLTGSQPDITVSAALTENTDQTSPNMGEVTGTVTVDGAPCFSQASFTIPSWASGGTSSHSGQTLHVATATDGNGVSVTFGGIVNVAASSADLVYGLTVHGGGCDGASFNGTLTK